MARSDYREIVITDLADELVAREAQLREALHELETYRLMAKLAIHQLATLTAENKRLRDRLAETYASRRDAEQEAA
jgi:regulator of replication initiation timing